mgnify:CR=1 FL=1
MHATIFSSIEDVLVSMPRSLKGSDILGVMPVWKLQRVTGAKMVLIIMGQMYNI